MSENEKLPPPVNLKHRIVGAVILVSLAVIFLPMILSEREPPAELEAISEIPAKDRAPGAVPAPPVVAPPVPEQKAADAKPHVSMPATPARGWAVQVGVFANAANAAKLADKLKEQGYRVMRENVAQGGEKRVRLRVGPYADKTAAQQAQAKIRKVYGIAGAVQAYP